MFLSSAAGTDFQYRWYEAHKGSRIDLSSVPIILAVAGLAFLIAAVIILRTAPESAEKFSNAFGAVLLVYGVVPLILLLIENIIGFVILAVFVVLTLIFGGGLSSSGGADSSEAGGSSGTPESSGTRERSAGTAPAKKQAAGSLLEKARQTGNIKKDGKAAYVPISSGFRLVIRKDGLGVPCIYTLNRWDTPYRLCSVEAAKNRSYKIYNADTDKEIPLSSMPIDN
jgi:hypothetical protein